MAAFHTHVTTGLLTGYCVGASAVYLGHHLGHLTPLSILVAAFIGSFLPDLDCQQGKPFVIVFSLLSIVSWGLSFLYFIEAKDIPWLYWVAIPPLVGLFVRYGLGAMFKKFTTHRGIFHSIPGMLIATLATPLMLSSFRLAPRDVAAIALSLGLGFLSHLVLDEIYAVVDFQGGRIKPKKSFGTALSLTSSSRAATASAYLLLALLFMLNYTWTTGFFPGLQSYGKLQ